MMNLDQCIPDQCTYLLFLAVSASPSLWGKKVVFDLWPCVWHLGPEAVVPALEELSVCVLFRRNYLTDWTGFVYKAPGGRNIELGLGGRGGKLVAWLFEKEWRLDEDLPLHIWHSVCLTWSGQDQRLRVYINGSSHLEAPVNTTLTHRLAPNGTLTLGMSHNVDVNGKLKPENGNSLMGEIGRFRMWTREWSAEEMRRDKCADGDVVSWDLRHWSHSCPLQNDNMLHCGECVHFLLHLIISFLLTAFYDVMNIPYSNLDYTANYTTDLKALCCIFRQQAPK